MNTDFAYSSVWQTPAMQRDHEASQTLRDDQPDVDNTGTLWMLI
jgi:hypothetical protein